MTYTQKLFAAKVGRDVHAGEIVELPIDLALGNDITAPVAIAEFEKLDCPKVFDNEKIVLVPDHFTPNKDIASAALVKRMREFAHKMGITHYFETGRAGIEHCLLPEQGLVKPYDIIIGADSHTCTYGALSAFATGVGSTDLACAFATGRAWFKIPAGLRFNLTGKPAKNISGKDIILYIIGKIGVEGAAYRSMEYAGEGLKHLSIYDRFTIANMAIEAGAKNAYFAPDNTAWEYYEKAAASAGREVHPRTTVTGFDAPPSNKDYEAVYEIDLSALTPQVARPHSPANTVPAKDAKGVKLDQVVIGSCTNGWLCDLRAAAEVLKGQRVAKHLRCIIIPGTQQIYLEALREGLIEIFIEAGAVISTPTCGPCLGGHMGVLAAGEVALATTNRNFKGRMGHPQSEVYLSGPLIAAASAVAGEITV